MNRLRELLLRNESVLTTALALSEERGPDNRYGPDIDWLAGQLGFSELLFNRQRPQERSAPRGGLLTIDVAGWEARVAAADPIPPPQSGWSEIVASPGSAQGLLIPQDLDETPRIGYFGPVEDEGQSVVWLSDWGAKITYWHCGPSNDICPPSGACGSPCEWTSVRDSPGAVCICEHVI